ncbi:class I SAM-dependent methyltransferase [Yokenella regensburgei]|uniref:class I SAM-dependent methyltransferase n=1 Tax=Yokenella regensburgei TaxID=158877 RepID=UPI0020772CBB|nr:class I SAM-dependent methyltransferase [Yokenella regensburgei]
MMTLVTLSPADFFALDDFMYFQQDRLDNTVTEQEINSIIDITAMPGKLHILDTPCGYGRHSKALMQRGHQVTGIDLSPRFIDQAQTYPPGQQGTFILGEMDTQVGEALFDLVLILFNSFGYYPHPRNVNFLERCALQLKPSGKIVIDTINGATLQTSGFMQPVEIVKGEESLRIEKQIADIQYEEGINLHYTITSQRKTQTTRTALDVVFYRPEELDAILKRSGFRQTTFYSGLLGEKSWDPQSKKMVVVVQK